MSAVHEVNAHTLRLREQGVPAAVGAPHAGHSRSGRCALTLLSLARTQAQSRWSPLQADGGRTGRGTWLEWREGARTC